VTFEPGEAPLRAAFDLMLYAYGPQHWWPGDGAFEISVGAVLTQNTAWSNVERAIARLKEARLLDARAIARADPVRLAECIRSAGYFNVKARRLQAFCRFWLEAGGERGLAARDTAGLRQALLGVHGIGPETADDILLYAFDRPVFVIDAYTRRLFERLGLSRNGEAYEALRHGVERALGPDAQGFNELHALIVRHAKQACRKRPLCEACCLGTICPSRGRLR
jgi:endonuclease-3 related protein